MTPIRLRPSAALTYDDCGRKYYYRYIQRLKSPIIAANLLFGTAVHGACTGHIIATADGKHYDSGSAFRELWTEALDTTAMEFSSTWMPKALMDTGLSLVEQFPQVWEDSGFQPLRDSEGWVIERRYAAQLTDRVILDGQPDLIAVDPEGRVTVLDLKTTASPYQTSTLHFADQLTDYQILIDAHAAAMTDFPEEGVSQLGFIELVKRKVSKNGKGPTVQKPNLIPSRTIDHLDERVTTLDWMAEDIQRGRFPRRARQAHNTPCGMCEFVAYCKSDSIHAIEAPEPLGIAS